MNIHLIVLTFLFSLYLGSAAAQPVLEIGEGVVVLGGSSEISLSVSAVALEEYAGFGVTIRVPDCMTLTGARMADRLENSPFSLFFHQDSAGGMVLLYSATTAIRLAGELILLTVKADASCSAGDYPITFATVNSSSLINDAHAIASIGGTGVIAHTVTDGSVRVETEDLDQDGMIDALERLIFGDLSRDGNGDMDNDGYSDYLEYYNILHNIKDPDGNDFDPRVVNASEEGVVSTWDITEIEGRTALGHGSIISLGSPTPTRHGFCWNTSGGPTTGDRCSDEGAALSTGSFSSSLRPLAGDTTYYVRAYETNHAGTSYGEELSFTTLEAPFPWVLMYHLFVPGIGKKTPISCDDGNSCTVDSYDSIDGCTHINEPDGTGCDDGDVCTTRESCSSGTCEGVPLNCDDGNECTADSCNATTGCFHTPNEGLPCAGGVCQGTACVELCSTLDCDDGDPCTTDLCDETMGCLHINLYL